MASKRHIYGAGTVNVETGNVATKQDINYFSANVQSATRTLIRMMEDTGRRFNENQIYDGCAVSNGGADVDIASGTAYIGGRWISVDAEALDVSSLGADIYNVVIHVSGVSETNSRDPSTGESINVFLEASGSWVDNDFKLVLGSAVTNGATVDSVINRGQRRSPIRNIIPYGTATEVSIFTGTKPVYREAAKFSSSQIDFYNPIQNNGWSAEFGAISGTSIGVTGDANVDGDLRVDGSLLTITNILATGTIEGTAISGTSIGVTGDGNFDGDVRIDGDLIDVGSILARSTIEGTALSGTSIGVTGDSNVDGNAQIDGTLDVDGAITGLSYAIGGNTLTTTEFAFLDGLDQALKQADNVQFNALTLTNDLTLNANHIIFTDANHILMAMGSYDTYWDSALNQTKFRNTGGVSQVSIDHDTGDIVTNGTVDGQDLVALNSAVATNTTHRGLTNDPHNVTPAQVGFGTISGSPSINQSLNTTSNVTFNQLNLASGEYLDLTPSSNIGFYWDNPNNQIRVSRDVVPTSSLDLGSNTTTRFNNIIGIVLQHFSSTTHGSNPFVRIAGGGGRLYIDSSSEESKENFRDYNEDTSKIFDLNPPKFYNHIANVDDDNPEPSDETFGYIAEDVYAKIPTAVHLHEGKPYSIGWDKLVIISIEEMKKLKTRIEDLEAK